MQQDVLKSLVGVDEYQFDLVLGQGDRLHDLEARSDAGSARNHPDVFLIEWFLPEREVAVAVVAEETHGPLHLHLVSHLHFVEVLRHLPALGVLVRGQVEFDEEHDPPSFVDRGNGRVFPRYYLPAGVFHVEENMAAHWQSKHLIRLGQPENELECVRSHLYLLNEWQHELVVVVFANCLQSLLIWVSYKVVLFV